MKKGTRIDFFLWIVATELVGLASGWLAGNIGAVYQELQKPPFSPPGWIFPVMWGILYVMMAISAYLIQNANAPTYKRRNALILYALQLLVNFSWSIVFFRFQMRGVAIGIILLLVILVIAMMIVFHGIRKTAVYWNIPYLLWLLFASYLNIGTFLLN